MPRWLMLLLVGVLLGAVGVIVVQTRYLPPRLSAEASSALRTAFEQADAERGRLRTELASTAERLRETLRLNQRLTADAGARAGEVGGLREDLASLVATLPPDPRGGPVAVRAARFDLRGDTLAYRIVLSRDRAGSRPFGGVLEFVVDGASGRADQTVAPAPVPVSVGPYGVAHGTVALPPGFRPRQARIRVLDGVGGKLMGQRIINVDGPDLAAP